jgi:hypothetical protein
LLVDDHQVVRIVGDVRLQDGSGIEATRDICAARPHTSVMVTSLPATTPSSPRSWPGPPASSSAPPPPREAGRLSLLAEGNTNGWYERRRHDQLSIEPSSQTTGLIGSGQHAMWR